MVFSLICVLVGLFGFVIYVGFPLVGWVGFGRLDLGLFLLFGCWVCLLRVAGLGLATLIAFGLCLFTLVLIDGFSFGFD